MSSKSKMIKASVWYTASNFLNRALGAILTPIMTRLLTTSEYGDFENFSSWATILVVITSLDMANVITRAKFDYEDNFDEYMSSVVITSILSTAVCYVIVLLFPAEFMRLLDMDMRYINILFMFLLFSPACSYYSIQQRVLMKYKMASLVLILKNILTVILSIGLVVVIEDRLWARTVGFVFPTALVGIVVYSVFILKGKKFLIDAVKYTLKLSIPLIPHNLSNGILFSSDRIIIKKFCSSADVAIYSLGYSITKLVYMFVQSINQAYTPWLYEQIKKENLSEVRNAGRVLVYAILVAVCGVLLVAPECILIFGGVKYTEVINVLPIIIIGSYFQFLYTLYVNYEYYLKITSVISVGTVIAAGVNFGLNIMFVPRFGYVAAAYTTLISYIVLYLLHFVIVYRTEYRDWVDNKCVTIAGIGSLLLMPISKILYEKVFLRYIIIVIYTIVIVAMVIKYLKDRRKISNEKSSL